MISIKLRQELEEKLTHYTRILKISEANFNRFYNERITIKAYYDRNFLDMEASEKGSAEHEYCLYLENLMNNRSQFLIEKVRATERIFLSHQKAVDSLKKKLKGEE